MASEQKKVRNQTKTPEPRPDLQPPDLSPGTPGTLAPFDWEEFEARFEKTINDATANEQELLQEFDRLVRYFNVWASAASNKDAERAVKRLYTRETLVKNSEMSLAQKRQHYTEVVKAFKSALALLNNQ